MDGGPWREQAEARISRGADLIDEAVDVGCRGTLAAGNVLFVCHCQGADRPVDVGPGVDGVVRSAVVAVVDRGTSQSGGEGSWLGIGVVRPRAAGGTGGPGRHARPRRRRHDDGVR